MRKVYLRKLVLLFCDIAMIVFSYVFVFYILKANNTFSIKDSVLSFTHFLVIVSCITATRIVFKTYGSIWRYADSMEYLYLSFADFIGCMLCFLVDAFVFNLSLPAYFISSVCTLSLLLVLVSRFLYRQVKVYLSAREINLHNENSRCVAIIGAGAAGVALLNELKQDRNHKIVPYCFIDTDKNKAGGTIRGVKVYYPDKGIFEMIKSSPVSEIIIAIPSMSADKKNRLVNECAKTGCKVMLYEYVYDRMSDRNKESKLGIRKVNIEDLLSRGVITFNSQNVVKQLSGTTILVTGGGGSIGSELCRQISAMEPKKLIILDIYENNAFFIERELKRKYGDKLNVVAEIASIRDKEKLDLIFKKYKPDYVFHAAAHKHVPLMENCVDEAVKNNIFGTHNVIEVCEKYKVKKMLLISTDKAVNPSSVMGATKRFCEMMIQSKKNSSTQYVAVRFGNVLGSNGSVIPIFRQQIEKGGPVTVTDKRITRYFMTIPEAVSLVLQAGTMAEKSEIFVLDMGEPVKIIDLAENMIRLSGFKPYEDIQIIEVGLRPGEKMYEELLIKTEELDKTHNDLIFIERDETYTKSQIDEYLCTLNTALNSNDNATIKNCLKTIIPTYKEPDNSEGKNTADCVTA